MASGVFESDPFAMGRFRLAYRGTYTGPLWKIGQKCVVKRNKGNFIGSPTEWNTTIQVQQYAQSLAQQFLTYCGCKVMLFPTQFATPAPLYDIHFNEVNTAQVNPHQPGKTPEFIITSKECIKSGSTTLAPLNQMQRAICWRPLCTGVGNTPRENG